jgi:hypothetical protein
VRQYELMAKTYGCVCGWIRDFQFPGERFAWRQSGSIKAVDSTLSPQKLIPEDEELLGMEFACR